MFKPRINPTIDLGHILMAASFVAAGIVGWVKMDNRVANAEATGARLESRIDKLEEKVDAVPVMAEQIKWLVDAQRRTERRSGYEPPPAPSSVPH